MFNLATLQASCEIILCEALIDALTFWCAGYRNVTSAYGIVGFTEEQVATFKRHGTERVLIAYDRDDAGERRAAKVAQALIAEGIECFRIHFPNGMDANEYALKVTPAVKSLGLVIRKAQWLGTRGCSSPSAEPSAQCRRLGSRLQPARPVLTRTPPASMRCVPRSRLAPHRTAY